MQHQDLTQGPIARALIRLALPIMGTTFIQMAYNMTDLFWIGKLGSRASAAVGTAGFLMWFAFGLVMIPKTATEALVSRAIGQKSEQTHLLVETILKLALLISLIYGTLIFIFKTQIIAFFAIKDSTVVALSISYTNIISFSYILFFLNPIFTALFNAYGAGRVPFLINMSGLVLNMLLDPLMIFGYGFAPLGIEGAALATLISQSVVTTIFIAYIIKNKNSLLFRHFKFFSGLDPLHLKNIVMIGMPAGIQSLALTLIAMILARIVARYGFIGIAVQKIGSQVEAITWMTASGFAAAISAFIGQNLGAQKIGRIKKGYRIALTSMSLVGTLTTALLVFFPREIFGVFLQDTESLNEGANYLRILAYSQFFMCIEIVTNGAFYGLGKTLYPSFNSTIFTALRIPLALVLGPFWGLSGVWWTLSISSIVKGIVIIVLYRIIAQKKATFCINKS